MAISTVRVLTPSDLSLDLRIGALKGPSVWKGSNPNHGLSAGCVCPEESAGPKSGLAAEVPKSGSFQTSGVRKLDLKL